MADPILHGQSRWLSVTITERPRARKNPILIELECAEGWALLPTAEAIARTVIQQHAGPPTPVAMDSDHSLRGRRYLALQVSSRQGAMAAADLLLQIPETWLYCRRGQDGNALRALAGDPIIAGITHLEQEHRELQEVANG